MKKLCAGCGVVFEDRGNNGFCSEKCRRRFAGASLIGTGTKNKPHLLKFFGKSNEFE